MNRLQFEKKISPTQPKGWLWKLLSTAIMKWLYENADVILPILIEKVFGLTKANRFLNAMMGDDKPDKGTTPPPPFAK